MKKTSLIAIAILFFFSLVKGQTYLEHLQTVNRFLETFDNGYYGPLLVDDTYLYCTIKDGRKSKIPISEISEVLIKVPKRQVQLECKEGKCVTGVNGSKYPQLSFRTNVDFDANYLASQLRSLVNALQNKSVAQVESPPTTMVTPKPQKPFSTDEKRVALVFGNSNYTGSAKLGVNPINDAKDIASTLRSIGFEVILKTDASLSTMNNAIRQFGKQNRDADIALFYFAGHGMQLERVNYLLPIGADISHKNDVSFECVSVGTVQKIMETSNSDRLNLIVLDACRNNPFRTWERGGDTGLADMTPPSGTLIAFATSPGSVASNGIGRNGLYTGELIKQLKKPQRIEDVFINARIQVEKKSGGAQSPWELARLRGKYFLVQE